MHPQLTDAELIARSVERPETFSEIFIRHGASIHRYITRRVGREVGDELTSETFLTAFRRRGDFDQAREDALPWLYGIAAKQLLSRARKERRGLRAYARSGVDPLADPAEIGEAADRRIDAQRRGPELARALAALKPRDREILLLFAWAELSYEQIAEALDVPLGTVRSRLSRARARIREQLERSGQELSEMSTAPGGQDG